MIKPTVNDQKSNDVDVINLSSSKTKRATKEQIVKKFVQTFLKSSLIILQTKGSTVATLKHYCLDYLCFLKSQVSTHLECALKPEKVLSTLAE